MSPSIPLLAQIFALVLAIAAAELGAAEPVRVLSVLRDFDGQRPEAFAPIKHHTWTAAQQQNAGQYSQLKIVAGERHNRGCQVTIGDDFPWGNRDEYRALTIGPDYLPPEADAVRMRVKVVRGKFVLSLGSPTVYFGHSDVSTAKREVAPAENDGWQTLEFSLHHDLRRNFRRARFGEKSPVIYYSRWIQEPLYLYVGKPSAGELLIDQVELLTYGEGRPFPVFTDEQVRKVATIADFEGTTDLQQAFTYFQEPIDFAKPAHVVRPDWLPPQLALVTEGQTGKQSLQAQQRGTEETCFTGIHSIGKREANAIQLTLKVNHKSSLPEVALDWMVYATSPASTVRFPWQKFQPPASWRDSPLAFTYYLGLPQTKGESYAFYHARRAVLNGKWTSLVLPCADFVCAFGQGDCESLFEQQTPLQCGTIQAIGFVAPYRQRQAPTTVTIDELSWVQVHGTAANLHSYWQLPPK
ncbi:hypothetical protein NA78x_003726 [Anatilimnocola sp. NA78]|uniref:hypothetical protein n=1 Tax=Anatilimnocola sp. NA78 TaxID=3415683 RepID=UPI003CE4DA67